MMDKKERVRRAFAHQEPDRVPLFELTIDNPTAAYVLGRDNLSGFGGRVRGVEQNAALIEGRFPEFHAQQVADTIELWRKLDLDVYPNVAPVPKNPIIPERVAEYRWRYTDPATGHWVETLYSPLSDAYDQVDSTLRQEGIAALRVQVEAMEATEPSLDDWDFSPVETYLRELGSDRIVMGTADVEIGSTWDWAEHFLMGMILEPELIHRYLDARLRVTLLLTEKMLQMGVQGMHGGYDWASQKGPMFSPRHFDKFVFPRLRKITDLCHQYGVPYIKHTDGNVNKLIDGMIGAGVDGFQAIEPRAGMDIAALKEKYRGRLTLIGNVDCSSVLVDGPVEAVVAQTEAVIRAAAPGGGFLLSSSNSIHPGVKPEYYLAMLETARRVGNYPIG
jgi:hypothetical protein